VTTCCCASEKHGRGKGRRGCLSGCYELGGERIGMGTGATGSWRRERGALISATHS
jgi:hypothetical protein